MLESQRFHFDDEKRNINVTINHYHNQVAANGNNNFLQNLATMALMSTMHEQRELELPKKERNLYLDDPENRPLEVEYEVKECKEYGYSINKIDTVFGISVVTCSYRNETDDEESLIKINDKENVLNLRDWFKYKLSNMNINNLDFIVEFHGVDKNYTVAFGSTNYFDQLINKFSKSGNKISFTKEIAKKLDMPFFEGIKEYLDDSLVYLVTLDNNVYRMWKNDKEKFVIER